MAQSGRHDSFKEDAASDASTTVWARTGLIVGHSAENVGRLGDRFSLFHSQQKRLPSTRDSSLNELYARC